MVNFVFSTTRNKAKEIYNNKMKNYIQVANLEAHLEEMMQIKSVILDIDTFNKLENAIDEIVQKASNLFDLTLEGKDEKSNLDKLVRMSDLIIQTYKKAITLDSPLDLLDKFNDFFRKWINA